MTIFNKQELLIKFNLVKSSISRNSTITALNNLLIKVNGNKFELTGGNGELQVTAKGDCSGSESFSACVSPATFGVMLSAAKEDVQIALKDGKLQTISARSKFNIPTLIGDMYPIISIDGEVNNINLRYIINDVYKAAPKTDVRTMMMGTCIDYSDGMITAIATDGTIMIISSTKSHIDGDIFSIIIPNQSAAFFANIDIDGFVVSEKSIKAISKENNVEIISRLIDSRYANWRRIVAYYNDKFEVNKEELKNAVSIISKSDKQSATLKSNENSMSVYCEGINTDIDFSGDEFHKSYDANKLLTCIDAIDSDKMELSFDSKGMLQSQHNGVRFFIAPMNI